METELSPWFEDHVGGHLCQVMACLERGRFYRYDMHDGLDFCQRACIKHAGKEHEYCPHCGQYLDGRETCPKCGRGKEEQDESRSV